MAGRVETLRETQGIMEDLREMPAGTVAIFTLIGDDAYHAILRTPDAQKAYEYPIKAADLNRKILEFREAVQDPTIDPKPLGKALFDILLGGMAADLRKAKAETLMWSLDGTLRYVPLAALYDGKQYLAEQYRVSVMTLASSARMKDKPDAQWKAAGFGVTKAYEDTSALPSVTAELTGIQRILGGEIKLDDQFTQASMREMLLKRYPVVHIASHFRFQPGNDTKSFLLLGDGAHLSLAELKTSANLFGGVQLLTLSACNTGIGDGAEVEGFGTLAQRQGAKAVIASLWPVADESTSGLMQEFYRIRESSAGMTKLEALRVAQLSLLRGKYSHPYYWAPFFLMGNWL
jgi:CHAT domain-containing protein